jgi:hypothetical protein
MSKVKQGDVDVFHEFTEQLYSLSTPAFRDELNRILSELAKRRHEEQWRALGLDPRRFHPGEVPATMKQSDEK